MTELEAKTMCLAEIGRFDTDEGEMVVYLDSLFPCEEPHFHVGDAATYPDCMELHVVYSICSLRPLSEYDLPDSFLAPLYELLKSEWHYLLKTWNKQEPIIRLPLDTPLRDHIAKQEYVTIYLNSNDGADSPLPASEFRVFVEVCRDWQAPSIQVEPIRGKYCIKFNAANIKRHHPVFNYTKGPLRPILQELGPRLQEWLDSPCHNTQFETNRAYAIYNYRILNSK